MSDINGFGPPGNRYPNQIFVHGLRQTGAGTELTVCLDDGERVASLMVAYPPHLPDFESKFLHVVDAGPPPLRSTTIVAPQGADVVAFRCLDAYGNPIEDLCCLFTLREGQWMTDAGARPQGPADDPSKQQLRAEQDEVNERLYVDGGGHNCCVCGGVVPGNEGYQLSQLGADVNRAIRLETSLADEFPFICLRCYQRKFGGLGAHAIGSASSVQGTVSNIVLFFLRSYLVTVLAWNLGIVSETPEIAVAAFVCAFIPIETIPRILINLSQKPIVMLAVVFVPVVAMLFFMASFSRLSETLETGGSVWSFLGLENAQLISTEVGAACLAGAVASLVVGNLFGGED